MHKKHVACLRRKRSLPGCAQVPSQRRSASQRERIRTRELRVEHVAWRSMAQARMIVLRSKLSINLCPKLLLRLVMLKRFVNVASLSLFHPPASFIPQHPYHSHLLFFYILYTLCPSPHLAGLYCFHQMTQKQLGQAINENPKIVQDYESGKAIPSGQILAKLDKALGTRLPRPGKGKK